MSVADEPRRAANGWVMAPAWAVALLAWSATVLGLVGPRLGGSQPGLQGRLGYASELVVTFWIPGGGLALLLGLVVLVLRARRPALLLLAVALVVLLPEAWSWGRPTRIAAAGDADVLRVATVNLAAQNRGDASMQASLRELDADVLVLLEFTDSWAAQLEAWLADDYPYRWRAAAPDQPGLYLQGYRVAVWSRLPAAGVAEVRNLAGVNAQVLVPLRWGGRDFALFALHPRIPHPYSYYRGAWRDRLELLDWIRAEPLPTVVAGDFNAPQRSAFLRRLREHGLSNASEAVHGRALVTWPMQPAHYAPLRMALDHVMYSEDFRAVGFRKGLPSASDHASIVAELVWREGLAPAR